MILRSNVNRPSSGPTAASPNPLSPQPRFTLRHLRAQAEIHAISSALKQTGWNRKRAAQLLSISYRGLLYKIRRHNITPSNTGVLKPATDSGDVQS